jgi:hypothetical protein
MKIAAIRTGGAAAAAVGFAIASAARASPRAGIIASNSGRAMLTPTPRNIVRLEID